MSYFVDSRFLYPEFQIPGRRPSNANAVEIDKSHPFAESLIVATYFDGGGGVELVTNQRGVAIGAPTGDPDGTRFEENNSAINFPNLPVAANGSTGFAYCWGYKGNGNTGTGPRKVIVGDGASAVAMLLSFTTDAVSNVSFDWGSSNKTLVQTTDFSHDTEIMHHYCITGNVVESGGNETVTLYVDGAINGTNSEQYFVTGDAVATTMAFGNDTDGFQEMEGVLSYVWIFNKDFTGQSAISITQDPFQVLKPTMPDFNIVTSGAVANAPTGGIYGPLAGPLGGPV